MATRDKNLLIREDAFWDAVVSGQTALHQIEPETVRTIAHARALDDASAPAPAFVHSLRQRLVQSDAAAGPRREKLRLLSRPHTAPVPGSRFPAHMRDWSRRWKLAAVAAVLVLIAVGFVLGSGEFGRDKSGGALAGPTIAAPTAASTSDVFFQITLPAASLPTGPNITSGAAIDDIPIGISSTWTPACCPGPTVECPIAGTMTVQGDAPSQVERADGSIEAIPADAVATVGAGDCLISDNGTTATYTNVGSEAVVLFHWMLLVGDPSFGGHFPSGWVTHSQPDIVDGPSPGSGTGDCSDSQGNHAGRRNPEAITGRFSVCGPRRKERARLAPNGGATKVLGPKIGAPVTAYILTFDQPGAHPATATP